MQGAVCWGWNYDRRPRRYLLSTDSNDISTWSFSVSIVSPNFAETFVKSHEFVPAKVIHDKSLDWIRCRTPSGHVGATRKSVWIGGQPHAHTGENNGEGRRLSSPSLRFWFFRDQRLSESTRLHVLMDVVKYLFLYPYMDGTVWIFLIVSIDFSLSYLFLLSLLLCSGSQLRTSMTCMFTRLQQFSKSFNVIMTIIRNHRI